MRQFLVLAVYLFAQAGVVGGGVYFAFTTLREVNGLLAFCFCLFLVFEAWMVFIYVLAPLMIWARRADDAAVIRSRHN